MDKSSRPAHLSQAAPVASDKQLRTLLTDYLGKGLRVQVPRCAMHRTRDPRRSSGVGFGYLGSPAMHVAGFLADLPFRSYLTEHQEYVEELAEWWIEQVARKKHKAHHLVMGLSPEYGRQAYSRGIDLEVELGIMVRRSLLAFEKRFHLGDRIGYAAGIHSDASHPHCHCVVFPYTEAGKRISFSPNYQFPGRSDGLRRNLRGGLQQYFVDQTERFAGIIRPDYEAKDQSVRQRSARVQALLALAFPPLEPGENRRRVADVLPDIDEALALGGAPHRQWEEINQRRRDAIPEDASTALMSSLTEFRGMVKRADIDRRDICDLIETLDLGGSADSKTPDTDLKLQNTLTQRQSITDLRKEFDERRAKRRAQVHLCALVAGSSEEMAAKLSGGQAMHVWDPSFPDPVPGFEQFTSDLFLEARRRGPEQDYRMRRALIVDGDEEALRDFERYDAVREPSVAELARWRRSEAIRIAQIAPDDCYSLAFAKRREILEKIRNPPEIEPTITFLELFD